MSNLISANWNNFYGMENAKLTLNKVSHFGAIPMNQHYIFFKNGATSMFQNDKKISPEIKKILEDERVLRARASCGDGTERPIGFIESQMNDLYYNSFGLEYKVGSIGFSVDAFMIVMLTGGQTSLVGLFGSLALQQILQNAVTELFSSSSFVCLPKIGYTDFYAYETENIYQTDINILRQIINRKYPFVNENTNKLNKDQLINLSSKTAFKKIIGQSSYDTLLSKYQFNGGCGFFSSPFKGISSENLQSFVDNLLANTDIKYSQVDKLSQKYQQAKSFITKSKDQENTTLKYIKNKITGVRSTLSLHIDFSDYIVKPISSSQKGYPNPKKGKSIFGPYICRSKKSFLYYPKIIISHPKYSTLAKNGNGMSFQGGINIFGAYPSIFSTGSLEDFASMQYIIQLASLGFLPQIGGSCNYINKDEACNLGAAYTDGKTNYKPYKACSTCP